MNNPETQGKSLSAVPNIKPLSEWSDGELKVRVGELCGWRHIGVRWQMDGEMRFMTQLPNYPSDLNAMHESVSTWSIPNKELFQLRLLERGNICDLAARDWAEVFVEISI